MAERLYKADTVRAAFVEWFEHGADTVESDQGEIRMYCPVHEDRKTSKSASASMNPEKGYWNCLSCPAKGTIRQLARSLKAERGWDIRSASLKAKHQDSDYAAAVEGRLAAAGKRSASLPDPAKIESWSSKLLASPQQMGLLNSQRGLTQKTIIDFEIGYDGDRFTIPIYDVDGNLVNVRRYKINAARHQDKMFNIPGHGSAAIYGLEVLKDPKVRDVVITEGEMDRLLATQMGISAVTHTSGAATFRPPWGPLFTGKRVWIAYDNDDGGKKGALKVSRIVGAYADATYIIDGAEFGSHKGADVTDYLHKEGHSTEDFLQLMKDAEEAFIGAPLVHREIALVGKRLSLQESMAQENQNEIIELVVSVAGKQEEPYTAPKIITATCDMSKGPACTLCPIAAQNGSAEIEIRQDDEQIYRFVDSTEDRRAKLLKQISGARCSDRVEFEVPEDYHVEELLVQPSVDDRTDDESQQPVRRTVFSVSTHRSTVNEKIRVVGRNVPDPKTGKLRFMSWVNERVDLDIDHFELTPELREELTQFQPDTGQSPLEKCREIAGDMADNVTHIYGRDILHVAYDLVWHSVLSFSAYGMYLQKGWLEMMVVGDTRTGKSEIARNLMQHYRAGQMLSCEGMSFAGLVGGVQQIDGRWHMTWGAVPMNDRRLVVMDEFSGLADKHVIDQMSSIRSSGIAQITKISQEQTSARTRLIMITNPGDGSMLSDSGEVGMAALRSVVPNNEDQARFDFVVAAAKGEVEDGVINSGINEHHAPSYPSKACEALIKWSWSLGRGQVELSAETEQAAADAALDMGKRYLPEPPLVQSENVRFKILRVASALAARTFSVTDSGSLRVGVEHVRDAVRFLDEIYESEAMGYSRRSRRAIAANARARERKTVVFAWLKNREDVLETLRSIGSATFRGRDFEEIGGLQKEDAAVVVKQMVQWRMITRRSRGDMRMNPTLLEILRDIEDEEDE